MRIVDNFFEMAYLLKYCTMPSIHPMKHSAQRARHASTGCPSALALFLATFKSIRMSSRIVTISEPKAIEPSESVDARTNAERVG